MDDFAWIALYGVAVDGGISVADTRNGATPFPVCGTCLNRPTGKTGANLINRSTVIGLVTKLVVGVSYIEATQSQDFNQ